MDRIVNRATFGGHEALAILRIITALLFIQHGTQKLFGWPPSEHHGGPTTLFSLVGVGGLLELVGGLFVLTGLYTRPVAFVLAGQMAVAYWLFHFASGVGRPNGWMPVVNGGDLAILFCFVFLYLVFSGPGAWSVDASKRGQRTQTPSRLGAETR